LPLLKKFPTEYIYEPWKAPLSVQKTAGCIIGIIYRKLIFMFITYLSAILFIQSGKDYPRPIVQHEVISKENLQKMKNAYQTKDLKSKEEGIYSILTSLSHLKLFLLFTSRW